MENGSKMENLGPKNIQKNKGKHSEKFVKKIGH
jgi:hypothetical protein